MFGRPVPRVLHVVVGGEIGGAERLILDLASRPEASRAEHEIAIFTPNRALVRWFADAALTVHDRGPVAENPIAYLWRSLGPTDVAWLARIVRERRIDVVHTHTLGSHVVGTRAARRTRTPQVRTEHHVMHYHDPSSSPFTRWAAARTERFAAVSEYVRAAIVKTAPALAARTSIVRNGVDTEYWSPRPRDTAKGDAFRLAIVCRLTAWKRVGLAIEAAALAGAELVVVGDGEERGRLEAFARARHADVRFAGYQRDPRPFIADADATMSTSDDEPLGLAVLESLSMERPVIAYAGGGIPEIVQDGTTGLLTKQPTADALASLVARARSDRHALRRMGEAGRRFATDAASIARMCEGYAVEYARLAKAS